MEISYLLLVITCFFYGASLSILDWDELGSKIVNVLVIITIIVLSIITGGDGFVKDEEWVNLLIPPGAVYLGVTIGGEIEESDWQSVFGLLTLLGIVATIITTCCGV